MPVTCVRCPEVSNRNRSRSPSAIPAALSTPRRAAASSRARGRPSRRRHTSAIASTSSGSSAAPRHPAKDARSMNNRTASATCRSSDTWARSIHTIRSRAGIRRHHSRAKRVLPQPPIPVNVTSLRSANAASIRASSVPRPMKPEGPPPPTRCLRPRRQRSDPRKRRRRVQPWVSRRPWAASRR